MAESVAIIVPAAPAPSTPGRSRNLAAVRRRDTRPELRLRSLLHRAGWRFRVDLPVRLDGRRLIRPDIVFTRRRVAVFVDSCFWHCCPAHGHTPATNGDYWVPKLARNRQRDLEQTAALENAGWLVIRVWAHEPATSAAERIADALAAR